jgi:sugar diacid utilization regulator
VGAEPVPVRALTSSGPSGDRAAERLRGVHQQMVDAALAGSGIDRIAELASAQVGRAVLVLVPGHGHGTAEVPAGVELEVPVVSGGEVVGAIAMMAGAGPAAPDAAELLHMAALATVTTLALEEAREHAAARLGTGLIQELRQGELDGPEVTRRAARLGCDLVRGAVAVVTEVAPRGAGGAASNGASGAVNANRPRQAMALISNDHAGAISELIDGRIYAVLPARGGDEAPEATVTGACRLAGRLRSYGQTGVSSFYTDPEELGRAIQEAELVLEVVSRDERMAEQLNGGLGSGVYRLLFRALASHPEEVRSFYEDTVARIVRYDDQYHTDLLATLEAYLANDCNMNATARAIYAHRHTVAYRLQRVRELTELDPMISEDRERLGLGLKAYRIVAPTLPR